MKDRYVIDYLADGEYGCSIGNDLIFQSDGMPVGEFCRLCYQELVFQREDTAELIKSPMVTLVCNLERKVVTNPVGTMGTALLCNWMDEFGLC